MVMQLRSTTGAKMRRGDDPDASDLADGDRRGRADHRRPVEPDREVAHGALRRVHAGGVRGVGVAYGRAPSPDGVAVVTSSPPSEARTARRAPHRSARVARAGGEPVKRSFLGPATRPAASCCCAM